MTNSEHDGSMPTYDRNQFVAFQHYYIPSDENHLENSFRGILQNTPPAFSHLAEAFRRNFGAVTSTASMPFRMASANHTQRVYRQLLMAEEIRMLKPEHEGKSEDVRHEIANEIARSKFSEIMASKEGRHRGGLAILADLEDLLRDDEMKLAAAELMRQAEVLTWGTLEVLANDLFIELVNKRPEITDNLLKDERTKKRLQPKDLILSLPTYGYDLSKHMGDVLSATMKLDDVETLRAIYGVLMPNNQKLLSVLGDSELWKLNQRRNLILHRRSIVDEMYRRNTGDTLTPGAELNVSPEQFEKDLSLVLRIGCAILEGLGLVA
jgi:hypothetical protein